MKASFVSVDVTPQRPVHMAAYNRLSLSTGVYDPIQINVSCIQINESILVYSALDAIILDDEYVNIIQKSLFESHGIPKENIILAAIHTHSAPAYFKLFFENTIVETTEKRIVIQKTIDAIIQSIHELKEARASISNLTIDGIYGNRNNKDGFADKSVQVLRFESEGIDIGALVNIAVHPTILNGDNLMLSADLLGGVRNQLRDHLKMPIVITNGTCGDVSTRFYRTENTPEGLTNTATAITSQVLAKLDWKPLEFFEICSSIVHLSSSFDAKADPFILSKVAELNSLIDRDPSDRYLPAYQDLLSRLHIKMDIGDISLELISNIHYFKDLFIISLPGDVVAEFGLQIKGALAPIQVILICYSNTYANYLVSKNDYGKYFETFTSRLPEGTADLFISKVITRAKEMKLHIDRSK